MRNDGDEGKLVRLRGEDKSRGEDIVLGDKGWS